MDELKKFQHKFNKVKKEMSRWEDLQIRFVSQFRNASSIIQRLPELQDCNYFLSLQNHLDMPDKVLGSQVESLQTVMVSMNQSVEDFVSAVASLDKIVDDGRQLIKGESIKQLQMRIGVRPSLAYCLEGLQTLRDMYKSEYQLKSSLVTAFRQHVFEPNADDLSVLQQISVDQPSISKEEADSIFNIIFSEDH